MTFLYCVSFRVCQNGQAAMSAGERLPVRGGWAEWPKAAFRCWRAIVLLALLGAIASLVGGAAAWADDDLAGSTSLMDSTPERQSDAVRTNWATGTTLAERLDGLVGVTLSGRSLREGLYRLGETQGVGVLLDRRIDPGLELDLTLRQVPLADAFRKIAEAGDMGVTQLGPLFYFGPRATVEKLRTLAAMKREELQQEIPREVALRLAGRRGWSWGDLATPRGLIELLAEEGQFRVEGLEQIPHDLWAAADLPPLTLIDRLVLVAAQYDRTFSVSSDGTTLRLVPLPQEIAVVRRYPGGAHANEVAKKTAALAPDAQVRVVGRDVYVKGTVEEHERIVAQRSPTRKPPVDASASSPDHITIPGLNAQNIPVGAVLKKIASQLNLELTYDDAAMRREGVSLDTRISIHVENVSLDELLEEVTGAAGLVCRREGRRLEIRPRP